MEWNSNETFKYESITIVKKPSRENTFQNYFVEAKKQGSL